MERPKMKLQAIDRDLEHYLRMTITDSDYVDIKPGYIQDADEKLEQFIKRYNLDGREQDFDVLHNQLEAILQAQIKTKVIYNSQ